MHQYLRAIGFSEITKQKEIDRILDTLQDSVADASELKYIDNQGKESFRTECSAPGIGSVILAHNQSDDMTWQMRALVGPNIGINLSGYIDDDGVLVRRHYYPYLISPSASSTTPCTIYRHIDEDIYSGMIEDDRFGLSLIFRLDNAADYLTRDMLELPIDTKDVHLAALCNEAKIILPSQSVLDRKGMEDESDIIKESLLEAARSGDEEAIDALTIRELTLNSQISRRIDTEDIYTIVDSCFIPQGIECDTYSIVGQIRNINKVENVFGIESNRIIFSLAINEKDLTGEPAVGRRFKGTIWMMGTATWRD